jgi:hypothetical protein
MSRSPSLAHLAVLAFDQLFHLPGFIVGRFPARQFLDLTVGLVAVVGMIGKTASGDLE